MVLSRAGWLSFGPVRQPVFPPPNPRSSLKTAFLRPSQLTTRLTARGYYAAVSPHAHEALQHVHTLNLTGRSAAEGVGEITVRAGGWACWAGRFATSGRARLGLGRRVGDVSKAALQGQGFRRLWRGLAFMAGDVTGNGAFQAL